MPRPRRSVMGAGRGDVGHREGRKQERHVSVKESGRKKKGKKEEKKSFERVSVWKRPDLRARRPLLML